MSFTQPGIAQPEFTQKMKTDPHYVSFAFAKRDTGCCAVSFRHHDAVKLFFKN